MEMGEVLGICRSCRSKSGRKLRITMVILSIARWWMTRLAIAWLVVRMRHFQEIVKVRGPIAVSALVKQLSSTGSHKSRWKYTPCCASPKQFLRHSKNTRDIARGNHRPVPTHHALAERRSLDKARKSPCLVASPHWQVSFVLRQASARYFDAVLQYKVVHDT
jgi:hypothetical protein